MTEQEVLRQAWLAGKENYLSGREQAKAWALREVWHEMGRPAHNLVTFVVGKLRKTKNGTPTGDHPTRLAVEKMFRRFDEDPDWFPGKCSEVMTGPKRVLCGPKQTAIVSAAKRLKSEGQEPTYAALIAACPQATLNPKTGQQIDKKCVFTVFRECCFDDNPDDKWDNLPRLSRSALTEDVRDKRWAFAKYMLEHRHTPQWYFDNMVWCDLCNSLLAKTQKKASEMALARKSGRGWMSKGSQMHSDNLRMPKQVLKLNSSDTVRVWWVPILTRGKFHVEPLPSYFPGETPEGAELMVTKVYRALCARFPNVTPPKVVFTDRGNGFYVSRTGVITPQYSAAVLGSAA